MVDVVGANEKLRARVVRIVRAATGASPEEAEQALQESGGSAKVAIVSLLARVDAAEARTRLSAAGDSVRRAVEQ
jgi:N-acetylmuramic acid 6-phosphate etherase